MDQVNNIDEGMVQQQPALGEGLRPQRRISSNNASKLPKYDPAESIDQYLARVDFWFELEGVFTEREKLRQLMPYLPGKMFGEVRNAGLQDHPEPYIELKRLLTTAFGLNELERVRKLTEAVQLGNRKPGDVLRDMQELAVTTDEKIKSMASEVAIRTGCGAFHQSGSTYSGSARDGQHDPRIYGGSRRGTNIITACRSSLPSKDGCAFPNDNTWLGRTGVVHQPTGTDDEGPACGDNRGHRTAGRARTV